AFSMLVEVTERALAHTKKQEVMLCGGVAANSRLREMLKIMSEEHYADFYMPPVEYCGDNGAMIAWMGQLMNKYGERQGIEDTTVIQKYRTDQVDVPWMKKSDRHLQLPPDIAEKGAEANIYSGKWLTHDVLIKERIPKSYRIPEIDIRLRKERTKKEAKLLGEAKSCGVKTPLIYDIDKQNNSISLEKIHGKIIKEVFEDAKIKEIKDISGKIGENIANLHNCGIIHGDLTTSNLILKDKKIVFIDFGLGKNSDLVEDKGVDLLVFKKAITGIHYKIADICFNEILKGYEKADNYSEIIEKVEEIEGRGRYTL
ncbi:MAG: KEOPS complex kinase/ATPase Bud32, partial [Methanobacterium sp.]